MRQDVESPIFGDLRAVSLELMSLGSLDIPENIMVEMVYGSKVILRRKSGLDERKAKFV